MHISQFAQHLTQFADQITDEHSAHQCRQIAANLRASDVVITFGGHFSAGKSSLINALLGRQILPVDDLPETGVICHLTRSGTDHARLIAGKQVSEIACTQQAIKEHIALFHANGAPNLAAQQTERLVLGLSDAPIPPKGRWIDTPGINDSTQMNLRLRQAIDITDILVWVLHSRQPFSIVEQNYLAHFLQERGPAAVVLVMNVFLREDTLSDWATFQQRKLPVHTQKIKEVAELLGFTAKFPPYLFTLSARATQIHGYHAFGGQAIRDLIISIQDPRHQRVQYARAYQAEIQLQALRSRMLDLAQASQRARQSAKAQYAAAQQDDALRERRLMVQITNAVDEFLTTFAEACESTVDELIAMVRKELTRGDLYTQHLNSALQSAAERACGVLCETINRAAQHHRCQQLSAYAHIQLIGLTTPRTLSVVVVDQQLRGRSLAGGAAAGAAVGTVFPGIGTLFGAVIGAGAAFVREVVVATDADTTGTIANIRQAATDATTTMQAQRNQMITLCNESCRAIPTVNPWFDAPSPSERHLAALDELLAELQAFLQ